MRTYVITTGAIFALLVVAHIWRIYVERSAAMEPFFILSTLLAVTFTVWAWRLARRSPTS